MNPEEKLRSLIIPFSQALSQSVETLFCTPPVTSSPDWIIVPRLVSNYELACALGASNNNFSAVFAIGTTMNAMSALTQQENDAPLFLDAIGELANTCYSIFMSIPEALLYYDNLLSSPPTFCADGQSLYFPKVSGISGTVQYLEHTVWAGFAIR